MRDYIDIGSSPANELCAQVGQEGYAQQARAECQRFLELIRTNMGEEPGSAHLAVKANSHDYGTYYEVVCYYDDTDEEATRYAVRCQDEAPTEWGEIVAELGKADPETVTESGKPAPETDYLGLPIFAGSTETKVNSGMMSCDFCLPKEVRPVVDGRTKHGPWAAMCPDHFKEFGVGLGTGYGQRLVVEEPKPESALPLRGTVGDLLQSRRRPTTYCESCREAATEEGAPDDEESLSLILAEMGSDLPDHDCDGNCLCGCGRGRSFQL